MEFVHVYVINHEEENNRTSEEANHNQQPAVHNYKPGDNKTLQEPNASHQQATDCHVTQLCLIKKKGSVNTSIKVVILETCSYLLWL